ncbi:MAG: glycerophosphodiester phosphodiesterase family protein [Rhodothermales bacterium]
MFKTRPLFLAGLLVCGLGCASSTPPERQAPPYARTAQHYRAFADADALAAYLRADSEAGKLISAHRGGAGPAYPENALATFEHTLRYTPALIESDVRMSRDSVLVLMHDETLERTTTGEGAVAAWSFAALRTLLLEDERGIITPFRIPSLAEALAWAEGRAVLTLDIKPDVPPESVVQAIRRAGAEDRVVVITYTLNELLSYHRLAPDVLLSASVATENDVQRLFESPIDPSRLIAFVGVSEVDADVLGLLRAHNIRSTLGTFGTVDERARKAGPEVYQALLDRGVGVLATDVPAVAARALASYTTPMATP